MQVWRARTTFSTLKKTRQLDVFLPASAYYICKTNLKKKSHAEYTRKPAEV